VAVLQVVVDVETDGVAPTPLLVAEVLRVVRAGGLKASAAHGLAEATHSVVRARETLVEMAQWSRGLSPRITDAFERALRERTDDKALTWTAVQALDEALARTMGVFHQRIQEPEDRREQA